MEVSTKQIDSCIKMFSLLKLLLEDDANFAKVVNVISAGEDSNVYDNGSYSVTLNKYINTLKLFGLNVKKEKGKYYIENPPYNIKLTTEQINSLRLLQECACNLSNNDKEELNKIFKALGQGELQYNILPKLKFYKEQTAEKINICSKFCAEDFKTEIVYFAPDNVKRKITVKPDKLLYRNDTVYLQVLNLQRRETNTIPLDKIVNITQLPTKVNSRYKTNRITVYAIRGRLSKNYNLRTWEYSGNIENGWQYIINKDESEEELTKRILKYGNLCKVQTPHDYRKSIYDAFDRTLKLYEE